MIRDERRKNPRRYLKNRCYRRRLGRKFQAEEMVCKKEKKLEREPDVCSNNENGWVEWSK